MSMSPSDSDSAKPELQNALVAHSKPRMDKFQKFFSESIKAQPNFDINKMGKPTDKPSKPNKPTRQRNLLSI